MVIAVPVYGLLASLPSAFGWYGLAAAVMALFTVGVATHGFGTDAWLPGLRRPGAWHAPAARLVYAALGVVGFGTAIHLGPPYIAAGLDLTGQDLRGEDLTSERFDFTDVILEKADLSSAVLDGQDLHTTDLTAVTAISASLRNVNLSGAQMSSAGLTGTVFAGAVLDNARLLGARLVRADLRGALVTGTHFDGAKLDGADLRGLDLAAGKLSAASLVGAQLEGTSLRGATLNRAKLSQLDLRSVRLERARLKGADLTGANLSGVDLSGVDLEGADLTGALLAGALLTNTNLSRVVLRGADLTGARLHRAGMRAANLSDAVLRDAVLTGADLREANVAGAILSGTSLDAADLSNARGVTDDQLATADSAVGTRLDSPSVIRTALAPVCGGGSGVPKAAELASGAAQPIVVVGPSSATHPWNEQLPDEWQPLATRSTALVVCLGEEERVVLQVCPYNGPNITRYSLRMSIQVRAARTGAVLATRSFTGEPPRACNFSEPMGLTVLEGESATPELADVQPWLASFVER